MANWIAGAIKHPGALKAKAKAAGESTMAYASAHAGDSGTTGKQARLAETLQSFHSKGHHSELAKHGLGHMNKGK